MIGLRTATPDDAAALTRVASAAYEGYLSRMPPGQRPAPLDADYRAAIERDDVWLVERDGAVLAFVILVPAPDHVLIENVAVHPDFQGLGLGGDLMRFAETRAGALGADAVRLYTHATMVENQRWYERIGYRETDRSVDEGLQRVFYEKRLR